MPSSLSEHVAACERCRRIFLDNVALLVTGDAGSLTSEQEAGVLVHLSDLHEKGHR